MRGIKKGILAAAILVILVTSACSRSAGGSQPWSLPTGESPAASGVHSTPSPSPAVFNRHTPGAPVRSPTPDAPHVLPTRISAPQQYTVQAGDSLGMIAEHFSIPLDELTQANQLANPDHLEVGQVLTIPVTTPQAPGSDFKIIPDSELVYSPAAADFDVAAFLATQKGYINTVTDAAEDTTMAAAQLVNWVAQDYSVNPRLLLAVVEYQSGWLTHSDPTSHDYPVGLIPGKAGLYKQLAWAADNLNRGYYLWRAGAIANWVLLDGSIIPIAPTLNAGTAGVQFMFAQLMDKAHWEQAISAQGLSATYETFFGSPFDYALDPLLPANLSQPPMQLPFEPGVAWSFTGGPHGGWGSGSGWAALDFGPPGDTYGCFSSDAWDVAVAAGVIVRSEKGRVVEAFNGSSMKDGGWTVLYMHVEDRDRVALGAQVKAGDHIGHPSCTGGVADATHLHLVRRYNGEWIPADGSLPFNLEGWISSGGGQEYDGYLKRNAETLEAFNGREPQNQIQR